MIPMSPGYLLYYVPVLIAVSVVLSATRNEVTQSIWRQTIYNLVWITAFMLAVAVVMQVVLWLI